MKICGFLPLTLLDFPGRTACTVFTSGCNLRCPYCHNAAIARSDAPTIEESELFDFLNRRRGLLDGVCISGGEPLLQSDLPDFIRKIKEQGFAIKLDTNGTLPIEDLLAAGLVDYIAMDLKNSLEEYPKTIGADGFNAAVLLKNIEALRNSGAEYEFRTTMVRELHTSASLRSLASIIRPDEKWFLQQYRGQNTGNEWSLSAFSVAEMTGFQAELAGFVPLVELRGI